MSDDSEDGIAVMNHSNDDLAAEDDMNTTIDIASANGAGLDGHDDSGSNNGEEGDGDSYYDDDGSSDDDDEDEDDDVYTTKRALHGRLSPLRDMDADGHKKRRTMNGSNKPPVWCGDKLSFYERLNVVRVAAGLSSMPKDSPARAAIIDRLRPSLNDDNIVAMILAVAQTQADTSSTFKKFIADTLTPLFPSVERPLSPHVCSHITPYLFLGIAAYHVYGSIFGFGWYVWAIVYGCLIW
jgi:hypothetical protein